MTHKSGTYSETRSASKCIRTRAAGSSRQPASHGVKAAEWGNVSSAAEAKCVAETRVAGGFCQDVSPATRTWIVLRVRPQTEFETARTLEADGFAALVPYERKYRRVSRYSRKREPRDYPLFPRYVFAGHAECDGWIDALGVRSVSGVLGETGFPYRLTRCEVEWIHALSDGQTEAAGMNLHHALRAGQWAQIAEGPMAGLSGYIDAIRGSRASVLMEMLGVWRAVEMPLDVLEVA